MFDMSDLDLSEIHLETDIDYVSPDDQERPGSSGSISTFTGAASTRAVHASIHSVEMTLTDAKEYIYENGRRYPAYGNKKYILPNDKAEMERLDLTHGIWLMLLNDKPNLCPLPDKPRRVLDLGTGTGNWAIDFATQYPDTEVIGTDLSPIQSSYRLNNVSFQIGDFDLPWKFDHNNFDYIHMRNLMGSVKDWPSLLKYAYNFVKPSGFIEIQESDILTPLSDDNTHHLATGIAHYGTLLSNCSRASGRSMEVSPSIASYLRSAGFIDVTERVFKVPLGTWCKNQGYKTLGRWLLEVCRYGFESYGLAAFTRFGGLSLEDAENVIDGALDDCYNKDLHLYYVFRVVYGRKPVEGLVGQANLAGDGDVEMSVN